jgi:UDP-GlcNAc:undecaprenyl-phosphate/decaprenyl-phosphate GlcNAc-1-phosphate transferase
MPGIIVAAIIAALITMAVTPAVKRWSEKMGAIDQPEARRVNIKPIPRAGGVAIAIGFFCSVVFAVSVRQFSRAGQHTWNQQVVGILVAALFLCLVGLLDDFKNLKAKWQALAIAGSGLILCAFGVRIEGLGNLPGLAHTISWHPLGMGISVLVTVIWVFVVTKTVDAIDGLDGLAAGVCAICASAMAIVSVQLHKPEFATLALIAAALTGSCLGFLRYNYNPAKIIMGTIGSWLLGFILSAITILGAFKAAAAVSFVVPLFVMGVPIFDYAHVLGRRFVEGAPLTQADKRHLHHRLLARGLTQRQVVWCIWCIAALLCTIALTVFQAQRPASAMHNAASGRPAASSSPRTP